MDRQLTSFERRLEILFILMRKNKCSMKDLAFHYSVSDRTIRRDILFLSRYAPICTKTGIDGGAFLMSGYRKELYLPLSIDEESLLLRLMPTVCENEQHLIATIRMPSFINGMQVLLTNNIINEYQKMGPIIV